MAIALRIASVAALWLCVSLPASAGPCAGFVDVDDASSFCTNVVWMKNRQITLGCAAGMYCPSDPVARLSMAAFMNRLGDALLPPGISWVAPVGGTFQSIQQAIDAAAGAASASTPQLVKLAPGVYTEAITMFPHVHVEGSGEGVTIIDSANTCTPTFPPTTATVTGASGAQLRNLTVRNSGMGDNCLGVYLGNVAGTPLSNVTVEVRSGAVSRIGVRPVYTTNTAVLKNVTIDVAVGGGITATSAIGVRGVGNGAAKLTLQDSRVIVSAPANALAIFLEDIDFTFERVSISATATLSQAEGLLLLGTTGNVTVRDSAIRAPGGYAAHNAGSGTLRVANSLLEGTSIATTCFQTYNASFAAVTC